MSQNRLFEVELDGPGGAGNPDTVKDLGPITDEQLWARVEQEGWQQTMSDWFEVQRDGRWLRYIAEPAS